MCHKYSSLTSLSFPPLPPVDFFHSPFPVSPFLNHFIEMSSGVNPAGGNDSLVFHAKVKSWKLNPHKGDLLACCGQYAMKIISHKQCVRPALAADRPRLLCPHLYMELWNSRRNPLSVVVQN